jgi:pimeloyl-ACP methyl ester carboxylesterase
LPALVEQVVPGRVDAAAPVLAGHSAGGQLALWAASTARARPAGLRGVVALAPVADLAAAARLDLDDGAAVAVLGGTPEEVPDRYRAVDPVRLAVPPVPVVILHGQDDVQVPLALSEAYARHAGADLRVVPDADHFALVDPLSPAWPQVLGALAAVAG